MSQYYYGKAGRLLVSPGKTPESPAFHLGSLLFRSNKEIVHWQDLRITAVS